MPFECSLLCSVRVKEAPQNKRSGCGCVGGRTRGFRPRKNPRNSALDRRERSLRFFLRARSRLRSADAPGLVSFILRCLVREETRLRNSWKGRRPVTRPDPGLHAHVRQHLDAEAVLAARRVRRIAPPATAIFAIARARLRADVGSAVRGTIGGDGYDTGIALQAKRVEAFRPAATLVVSAAADLDPYAVGVALAAAFAIQTLAGPAPSVRCRKGVRSAVGGHGVAGYWTYPLRTLRDVRFDDLAARSASARMKTTIGIVTGIAAESCDTFRHAAATGGVIRLVPSPAVPVVRALGADPGAAESPDTGAAFTPAAGSALPAGTGAGFSAISTFAGDRKTAALPGPFSGNRTRVAAGSVVGTRMR